MKNEKQNKKEEKMETLTLEKLLNAERESIIYKDIEVETPGYEGIIKIRSIMDHNEMDLVSKKCQNLMVLGQAGLPPFDKKYTEAEIITALWCSEYICEPKTSFSDCLNLVRSPLGPFLKIVVQQVFKISGLTEKSIEEEERKLKQDSFQIGDYDSVFGITPSPS